MKNSLSLDQEEGVIYPSPGGRELVSVSSPQKSQKSLLWISDLVWMKVSNSFWTWG